MEVVTGATGSVLTKVGVLLQEEYIRQKGVKKDVESLQKELLFMRAALWKVAEVPPERLDKQVKAWASNVKELSYDMEDAVDTFNVRVTASKVHGRAWSIDFNKVSRFKARRQLADVIAEMKDLTMQVAELRDRYKLVDINHMSSTSQQQVVREVQDIVSRSSQLVPWWRHCISYRIQEVWARWRSDGIGSKILASSTRRAEVVVPRLLAMKDCFGMRDAMGELGPWVVKPHNDYTRRALYIVGDGGAGKTTLATGLLRKFGHRFDRRAAVTVSSMGSSHDAILKDIQRQLRPDIQNEQTEAALSHLVLIDGIESEEMWKNINDELPSNSTIIVTTRLSAVASYYNEEKGDKKHNMEAADEKEAKHMFVEAVLSGLEDGGNKHKEMRNSMNNIPPRAWEMCRGQPVAMMAMAGYAACNPHKSVDGWKQVCGKLLPESVKLLGRDGVHRVLSHCYHDMSAESKTCALYLSTYPKGHKINRKHLCRKLIAEGFVGEKPGQSVEEVVDDYVEELIRRKMIQPVEQSMNGKVEILQVYDLVHDFIVSKASEENLVTVAGGRAYLLPPFSGGKVRRLSHTVHLLPSDDDTTGEGQDLSGNMSHVRSLSVFWDLSSSMDARLPSGSLDSPIVQVLDLQGCKDVLLRTKHMGAIYKLFLLKYLGLRRTCISELGSDIGSLKNLETLDVRETHVVEMPDTVWKLQQLVNLLGGDKRARKALMLRLPTKGPKDAGKITMKALRVLSGIEITQELAPHLENLPNLRKLAIYKLNKYTDVKKLMSQLPSRGCLLNLLIIGDDELPRLFKGSGDKIPDTSFKLLVTLKLSGKLDKLPTWVQELVALKDLTLPITVLSSDPILLGKLVDLKDLFSITFSSFDQTRPATDILEPYADEIIAPTGGFAKLKILRFFAPMVPPLSFLDDAMPSLERIHLRFTKFEGLHGLHNLQMIQEVHLEAHVDADHFTMSMVHNLVDASRHKDFRGPRILADRYA